MIQLPQTIYHVLTRWSLLLLELRSKVVLYHLTQSELFNPLPKKYVLKGLYM